MEIITLLFVLVLARFTIRGFFDTEWRENFQAKIDNIKKRRVFWNLMSSIDGAVFDIDWVFTVYLDLKHVQTAPFSSPVTDGDKKIKNLIKDKGIVYDLIENVGVPNKNIEEREKIIRSFLERRNLTYTNAEVQKALSEERLLSNSEQYNKLVSVYFDLLPGRGPIKEEHEKIWKELEDKKVFTVGSLKHSTSNDYS